MEERQAEECISVASFLEGSGPSSVTEDYDHVFNKKSMGNFGNKLSRYGKVNIVKLHNTRRYFESLQMKETEDIDSFMNRVMFVINQLKIYGEDIKDRTMIQKVLRSLSTKFDVVVAAIEEAKDLEKLTIDELMGSLLSHKARINRNKDSTLETAFKIQVYI